MALNEECSRAREWTSLELDSALSRFESAGLRRHLKACADCRAYAADVRRATGLIRATALVPRTAPVAVPAARRWVGRAGTRIGAAAAVVASLAALVAGGLTSGGGQSPNAGATASGSSDLSSMRAIRRQQLAVSTAADTPRVRVIEID